MIDRARRRHAVVGLAFAGALTAGCARTAAAASPSARGTEGHELAELQRLWIQVALDLDDPRRPVGYASSGPAETLATMPRSRLTWAG